MIMENDNAAEGAKIRTLLDDRAGMGRRTFLKTAAASAALLAPAIVFAQSPETAPRRPRPSQTGRRGQAKSTGGLSKGRLSRMHDVMAGHVSRGQVAGLVTLVSRRGEVHVEAIGAMAVGGSAPMRRDTIFRIASVTKPVTAAAALILVEECKVGLDHPVDAWLPELADRKVLKRIDGPLDDTVPANRPISLRDLLTFRLGHGLPESLPDPEGDGRGGNCTQRKSAFDAAR